MRPLLAGLALLLLTACASPGPRAERDLAGALPLRYASALPADLPSTDAAWWQQFADPGLRALLVELDAGNLSLRQQLERVQQARAGASAQGARGWPQLGVNGSLSDARSELPQAVKRAGQPDVRAARLTLDLQWEIDLFGAAAAGRRAAEADMQAAAAARDGARLLLQTELAGYYLAWQSARRRLPLLDALIASQQASLQIAQRRAREGLASGLELQAESAALAALQARRPALQLLRETSAHAIALLLGRPAGQALPALQAVEALPASLPSAPPLQPGQPAELLLRRPDLRAAAARSQGEAERATQAQAERWPRLLLAGFWGRQDLRLNGADLAPAPFQQLALAFAAPLFSAGRLQGAADAQAAAARAAALGEQQAVLTALAEVESALQQRQAGEAQRDALAAQAQARQAQQAHVQQLLAQGGLGRGPWLAAGRARLDAELALESAELATRLDALQLAKALGGGWKLEIAP